MSSPTSATPKLKSSSSGTIRVCVSILVALMLGVFILLWDGGFIPLQNIPAWTGHYIFLPFLAFLLSFGANCLIQRLSCSQVQVFIQFQRSLLAPLPYILTWGLLYIFPGMRWPVEGLFQNASITVRHGLSSGFYVFWTALYTQAILNGLAQICPR